MLAQDAERRAALTALQEKQARRNALSREIGAGQTGGADTAALEAEATALRDEMEALETAGRNRQDDAASKRILEGLPNVLDPDVPDGPDETANVVLKQHGEPRDLGFQPRQHFELGEALGMMDFAAAAKIAGARFTVLRGPLARLERALGQFMIDLHTREHGYTEMWCRRWSTTRPPTAPTSCRSSPTTLFQTTDGRWLIPTAEVPLTSAGDGRDRAGKRAADPRHRADRLLPQRSRRGGPRHARHAAPAPVSQSRAGLDRASRPAARKSMSG